MVKKLYVQPYHYCSLDCALRLPLREPMRHSNCPVGAVVLVKAVSPLNIPMRCVLEGRNLGRRPESGPCCGLCKQSLWCAAREI